MHQELIRLITDDNRKKTIMIEALRWGLNTMRTTYALEHRLFHDEDPAPLVDELVEYWDGQNFISGALAAANQYIREGQRVRPS